LANPVAEGVGPGLERLAREVVIDIPDQRLDGSIPPLRLDMHRGEAEHVEIRPCSPADGLLLGGFRRPLPALLDNGRLGLAPRPRSEERRVGKGCSRAWST